MTAIWQKISSLYELTKKKLDTTSVGLTSPVLNMSIVPDFDTTTDDDTEGLTSVHFLLPNTAINEADDAVFG